MAESNSSNDTGQLDGKVNEYQVLARSRDSTSSSQTRTQLPPERHDDPRKRRRRILILAILLFIAAIFGYRRWQYASTHEWTNDAYVTGRLFQLNSRINDTVIAVPIQDNQFVRKGQPLVQLDPNDFQAQALQAEANLATARRQASAAFANIGVTSTNAQGQTIQAQGNISAAIATIANAQAAVISAQAAATAAEAQLFQTEADLRKTKADYIRYTFLTQRGVTPPQQLDSYRAAYEEDLAKRKAAQQTVQQTKAQLAQAQKLVANAEGQLVNSKGQLRTAQATGKQTTVNLHQYEAAVEAVKQAEANLRYAQLQLSYTNITSPTDGRVGNAETVVVGQRVQPGQALTVIQEPDPWIVANFKETQLEWVRPGQFVEIRIDAFPHHRFWGKVNSIAPTSGATVALLPPDNATGNFTKIVQRVPVKILFDHRGTQGYEALIVPGMSIEVTVVRPHSNS